ncbi:MAG: phenylalanine--tRNA ligase subunit alpha [Candidatus Micrarchaeia archaeon]
MNELENAILKACKDNEVCLTHIAEYYGLSISGLYSAAESLRSAGAINVRVEEKVMYRLSSEGEKYLREGFPEENLVKRAVDGIGVSALSDIERKVGLQWAIKKGLVSISGGNVYATDNGKSIIRKGYPLRGMLERKEGNDELLKRHLLEVVKHKEMYVSITDKGVSMLSDLEKKDIGKTVVDKVTGDIILHGNIEKVIFKEYNVAVPGEIPVYGRKHVLNRFMDKIRSIFIEMGFEEMEGSIVESAFWNFDALFQPQDHPARELADTFYLENPSRIVPDNPGLVEKIRKVHEQNWGGRWSIDEASRAVLRTHTTTLSARKLSTMEKEYGKFFSIGRVFRKEAIDYKHLAEFHQVEGIVAWEGANFKHLLWILREFYSKLGFERVIFKPSYFPYTEPSLEIHAFFKEKGVWVELGGAGIFREEVCYPLFGRYPVLAWGLSLERPLMVMLGIDDIRTFYKNNLNELEGIKEADLKWLS